MSYYTCDICKEELKWCAIHAAHYCDRCNRWIQETCGHPACDFCNGRPEKPLKDEKNKR